VLEELQARLPAAHEALGEALVNLPPAEVLDTMPRPFWWDGERVHSSCESARACLMTTHRWWTIALLDGRGGAEFRHPSVVSVVNPGNSVHAAMVERELKSELVKVNREDNAWLKRMVGVLVGSDRRPPRVG
jgi:hypothetical protein